MRSRRGTRGTDGTAALRFVLVRKVERLTESTAEATAVALAGAKYNGVGVRTPEWESFGEWPTEGSSPAVQTARSGRA
jgi:hypothetical protein